ncbi:MAG: FAD:protein FMN transferase, partial [Gammaproteobacteria bacterium]|nr:FAD:protein FMN transferase [Gammaproteobacteria bacterium]
MKIQQLTKLVFFITVLQVISACQQPSKEFTQRRILSFGTHVDVTLYGVEQPKADAAILEIENQLDYMHNQWHAWRKSSLTKLNEKLVSGVPFKADAKLLPLLIESKELYLKTKGLYNPAIGKLIQLWGFYSDNPEKNNNIPPAEKIQQLLNSNPNMSHVSINGEIVLGSNTDLQLDLGGYAKGYGVDRLVEQLKSQGIYNALVNAGGDLRAIGSPGDRSWTIAIQDPNK